MLHILNKNSYFLETLGHLVDTPRKKLTRLLISFDNFGNNVNQNEQYSSEEYVMACVVKTVETSASLAKLELIIRHGSKHLMDLMCKLKNSFRERNWDLDFQFYVKLT